MNIEPSWIKVKITYLDFNDHGGGLAQYAMILEDAAWTPQDFSKYVSALNTSYAIRQLKEVVE